MISEYEFSVYDKRDLVYSWAVERSRKEDAEPAEEA